jgi:hypothetical protein
MKHFKQANLPSFYNVETELSRLLESKIISWPSRSKQICLNTVPGYEDNIELGVGSLYFDWSNADPTITSVEQVPIKKERFEEEDFTVICSQFKGTVFEDMYNAVKEKYKIGRVRLMMNTPKSSMTWHTDWNIRLHYPIKTQEGCFMVVDDEVKHLEAGQWTLTNTVLKHAAFNASLENRIHFVATVFGNFDDL